MGSTDAACALLCNFRGSRTMDRGASACLILISFLHCNFLLHCKWQFMPFTWLSHFNPVPLSPHLQWVLFSSCSLPCSDKSQVSLPSFLHGKLWVPPSLKFLSLTLLKASFFSLYLVFGFEKQLTMCLRVEHFQVTCSSLHAYEPQS